MISARLSQVAPARAVDWQNPWPGLAAFEEGDFEFFKGRDAEVDGLLRLILREDLSLFSGVSGLGKTSLLRAGLFPRLRAADIFPVYVRLRYDQTSPSLTEQCFETIRRTAPQWSYEVPSPVKSGTLWEYVRRRTERFWGPGDRLVTPLLVFDQFEEVFTHDREQATPDPEIAAFFRDVSQAVTGSPPDWLTDAASDRADDHGEFLYRPGVFKVLLAFREDFFAHVVGLRALVPAIDHNHYRLGAMTFQQALSVVEGGGGHLFDARSPGGRKAICEEIVTQVAAAPTPASRTSATVDPALLSLFCRELNEKRHSKNKALIDLALVESAEAARIIGDFYETCMNKVNAETRRFVEERLVLEESRTRESIAEEAARAAQVPMGDIEVLIAKRILRRDEVMRRGQSRLELTHDVLVGPALEALQRRRIEAHRVKEEEERREREARERVEQQRQQQERDLETANERVALLEALSVERDRAEREAQARREADRRREIAEQDRLTRDLELQAQRADARTRKRSAFIRALAAALAVAVAGGFVAWQRSEENRQQLITTRVERAGDDSSAERPAQALARLADVMRTDPANTSARSLALDLLIRRAWLLPVATIKAAERPLPMDVNGRGSVMATADADTVRLWDVDSGTELGSITHAPNVAVARFSDDDRWLATAATDGSVVLWSGADRRRIASGVHPAPVTAVMFRPGADQAAPMFATGSADGIVRLWSLEGADLRSVAQLRHAAAVDAVEFTDDGGRLLTVSAGTISTWDAATGRGLKVITQPNRFTVAHFGADGKTIVTGSEDGSLRVWDTATSAPLALAQIASPIHAIVPDAAGRRILVIATRSGSAAEPTAAIWNIVAQAGPAGLNRVRLERAAALRSSYTDVDGLFVDDQTLVMLAAPDIHAPVRDVRLVDAQSGSTVQRLLRDDATSIRLSASGRRLLVGRIDGSVRVLAVRTALPSVELRGGSDPILQARFSRDGQRVLTASLDRTARIWDAQTRQAIRTFAEPDPIVAAEYSADEKAVLTTTGSVVRVWDTQTGQGGQPIQSDTDEPSDFITARLNAAATAVVTASPSRSARMWDARTGRLIREFSDAHGLWYAEFNPAGDRVVTASRDGRAAVWDATSGAPIGQPLLHSAPVFDARFSADGRRVVTASRDGTARVWTLGSGSPPIELRHLAGVDSAQFGGDSDHVVTTSKDWTARIWTLRGGSANAVVLAHESPVDTAQLDGGRNRLLTVSSVSGDVRVWDVATGQALSRTIGVSSAVWFAQFSPDGQRIVAACDDGAARIFATPSGDADDARSWLRELSEAVSGLAVDRSGTIVELDAGERERRLTAFRTETSGAAPAHPDFRQRFLRWFFRDEAGGL